MLLYKPDALSYDLTIDMVVHMGTSEASTSFNLTCAYTTRSVAHRHVSDVDWAM